MHMLMLLMHRETPHGRLPRNIWSPFALQLSGQVMTEDSDLEEELSSYGIFADRMGFGGTTVDAADVR